jgi:hypothetical protein
MNMDLATVRSSTDLDTLYRQSPKQDNSVKGSEADIWIGLNDREIHLQFVWADGSHASKEYLDWKVAPQ